MVLEFMEFFFYHLYFLQDSISYKQPVLWRKIVLLHYYSNYCTDGTECGS